MAIHGRLSPTRSWQRHTIDRVVHAHRGHDDAVLEFEAADPASREKVAHAIVPIYPGRFIGQIAAGVAASPAISHS